MRFLPAFHFLSTVAADKLAVGLMLIFQSNTENELCVAIRIKQDQPDLIDFSPIIQLAIHKFARLSTNQGLQVFDPRACP